MFLRVDFKLEKNAVDGYVVFFLDAQSSLALAENIDRYLKSLNL